MKSLFYSDSQNAIDSNQWLIFISLNIRFIDLLIFISLNIRFITYSWKTIYCRIIYRQPFLVMRYRIGYLEKRWSRCLMAFFIRISLGIFYHWTNDSCNVPFTQKTKIVDWMASGSSDVNGCNQWFNSLFDATCMLSFPYVIWF